MINKSHSRHIDLPSCVAFCDVEVELCSYYCVIFFESFSCINSMQCCLQQIKILKLNFLLLSLYTVYIYVFPFFGREGMREVNEEKRDIKTFHN